MGIVVVLLFICRSDYLEFAFFFFFQAEDGIRDLTVTGVQTCALPIFSCVLTVSLALVLTVRVFGQGQDRGVITGLVTDNSGAAVPDAQITITNEATQDKTVVTSSSAGNYNSPPLILGTYRVQIEKAGCKTFVRTGVPLASGATYRLDAALDVGSATASVEVQASVVDINVSNPEVSSILSGKYYHDLPAVMGSDIRLAESLLNVQPGYVPMRPNGDPIFRGSQFMSRMNGGQTMA